MCKQNSVRHVSITCPSSASQQPSGLTFLNYCVTQTMPKLLVPAGWVERPCRHFHHESTASSCGFCLGEFCLWNGRQHCHFCGHQFHRRRCSRRIQVDGWFSRRRICPNCDYYRNVARETLMQGEEFMCVGGTGGSSGAVFIALCEDTAELVLRWKETSVTETIDLLQVKTRRGFSHCGRLNSVEDYNPLRSFSLFLGDDQRLFDIRALSAWTAQLWVDGLTSAHYVYMCMMEQFFVGEKCDSSRNNVLQPCHPNSLLSIPCSTQGKDRSLSTGGSHSESNRELSPAQRDFQCGYYYKRSLSPPSSCKVSGFLGSRSCHSVCLSVESRTPDRDRSPGGTPGLPYIHSFLSSICRCHAYEIMPSRSVDVRFSEVERMPASKSCCRQCRNACKIAIDLDNL